MLMEGKSYGWIILSCGFTLSGLYCIQFHESTNLKRCSKLRCKACKGERSEPPEPEIVILRERKFEEKAKECSNVRKGTVKMSPKVKDPKKKRNPGKKQFQCPICDKFLSSTANLR